MNAEKKQLIETLAIAAHQAAEHHRRLSMQNVQTDPSDRQKQAVAYALATAEMFETRKSLDAALSEPPNAELSGQPPKT